MATVIVYLVIVTSTVYLLKKSYQYLNRFKNTERSKELYINVKPYDNDYVVKMILFIYLIYHYSKSLYIGTDKLEYSIFYILIISICVIKVIELNKHLKIYDNGLFLYNRFIAWGDIIEYKWEVVYTDKIERLRVTYSGRSLFLDLTKYNVKIDVELENKAMIDGLLKEKIRLDPTDAII